MSMKWRKGPSAGTTPQPPLAAGERYSITIDLWRLSYIIPAGHRLRLSLSSSNYPRFRVNPNNYSAPASGPTNNTAGGPGSANACTGCRKTVNTVHFGEGTFVTLPVVSMSQLPDTWHSAGNGLGRAAAAPSAGEGGHTESGHSKMVKAAIEGQDMMARVFSRRMQGQPGQ